MAIVYPSFFRLLFVLFFFSKDNSVPLFNQGSNATVSAETMEKSNKVCQHDNRLDEQIGIYCIRCGFVTTEIRDITQPFVSQV